MKASMKFEELSAKNNSVAAESGPPFEPVGCTCPIIAYYRKAFPRLRLLLNLLMHDRSIHHGIFSPQLFHELRW